MAQQLRMRRPDLEGLGEATLPQDYQIRTYIEGDEKHWAQIINNSLGPGWNAERCQRDLTDRPQFRPEGLFLATYKGKPIGTTCAWTRLPNETKVGYIHMVGVLPQHQGKKLGYALCLNALKFFRKNGFECAQLNTDDFRLPAIKTYLNLGFEPEYINQSHKTRWEAIFANLTSSSR